MLQSIHRCRPLCHSIEKEWSPCSGSFIIRFTLFKLILPAPNIPLSLRNPWNSSLIKSQKRAKIKKKKICLARIIHGTPQAVRERLLLLPSAIPSHVIWRVTDRGTGELLGGKIGRDKISFWFSPQVTKRHGRPWTSEKCLNKYERNIERNATKWYYVG